MRQALRALLERQGFTVVGEAADGREAVALTERLHPEVAVLDAAMPVVNGVEAAGEIFRSAPETRLILLTALDDAHVVRAALAAGVRGIVMKAQGIDDLVLAIRAVVQGGLYVSPGVTQAVLDAVHAAGDHESPVRLSERERQVLRLVAQGRSTKQIADVLQISPKTAEFHRGRVMEKLDIHDTAGLVRYAIREGLITA